MKNNEWYTPAKYIEAAREVMNGIDLDPASCALANETVKATLYYTKEDNGLLQPWHGRIWCNPPYGRVNPVPGSTSSYQKLFGEKLLREYNAGHIEQAIALVFGTSFCMPWFQSFWQFPIGISRCIDFNTPDGKTAHFGYGSLFVYLGPNEDRFTSVFSRFGRIVKAIDTPKPKPVMLDLWTPANDLVAS